MDIFRKKQYSMVAIGGFKCPCCNDFAGKNLRKKKQMMNKIVRASLKRELRLELSMEQWGWND